MEQSSQLRSCLVDRLAGVLELSVDVADGYLGAEHVDLRGRGPAVAFTGDLEKVFGKRAVPFEKCLGNLIKV